MIQLPKVKIPIKVGESEVTKPGLGRKMTAACCWSSSGSCSNVSPSMFSLGKMFANCFSSWEQKNEEDLFHLTEKSPFYESVTEEHMANCYFSLVYIYYHQIQSTESANEN